MQLALPLLSKRDGVSKRSRKRYTQTVQSLCTPEVPKKYLAIGGVHEPSIGVA